MQFLELIVPYFTLASLFILGATAFLCFFYPKWVSKPIGIAYLPLIGSFFAWAFSLLGFIKAPFFLPLLITEGDELFAFTPTFTVHEYSLPIIQFLLTIQLTRSLVVTIQQNFATLEQWTEELLYLLLSILACLAVNPLTLLIIWIAIDSLQIWTSLPFFHYRDSKPLIISRYFILRWITSFGFLWLMAITQGSVIDITLLDFSPILRNGLLLIIILRITLTLLEQQARLLAFSPQLRLPYPTLIHLSSYFAVLTKCAASGPFDIHWIVPLFIITLGIGLLITKQFSSSTQVSWMPLIFLAIAIPLTLQNDVYAVLGWSMTFILFSFFLEICPTLTDNIDKWNIIPALIVVLVLPFTPLWFSTSLDWLFASANTSSPFLAWITSFLLFIIQVATLFLIIRQMLSLLSPAPFWKLPLQDLPLTVMNISIWVFYFLAGVWISLHTPTPPLWAGIPYFAALLFLWAGSKIAKRIRKRRKAEAISYPSLLKNQLRWQLSQMLARFSWVGEVRFAFQRVISAPSSILQTASEIIEGDSGLLWGFIIFTLLITILFQPAP